MSLLDRLKNQLQQNFSTSRGIQNAIWIVLGALLVSIAAFGAYYYWDRYVRLDDRSPLEQEIAELERAIRENPQDPDPRVVLAELYLNKALYGHALEQTDQVLAVYPENQGALLIAGVSHVRLNRPAAALDPLNRLVALRQNRPMAKSDQILEMAYYYLGESFVKLGRPAEAIPVLEAALAIRAIDADALYQIGLAYHATGQPEQALVHYQRATRFVPDFGEAYAGMVESYTSLGQSDHVTYAQGMETFARQDYQSARPLLESATEALPDFAPAFLGLGLTCERLGDLEEARVAITRALELDPDDFAAQQAYGRIQATQESRGQ